MTTQWLSPNVQLLVMLGCLIAFAMIAGATVWYIRQRVGTVTDVYKAILEQLFAVMRHPHPWAEKQDLLMTEYMEQQEKMDPSRYAMLREAIQDRSTMANPDLRVGENDAAVAALAIMRLIVLSSESPIPLSGMRLVGSQMPADQTIADRKKTEDTKP